ncbi:MAG: aspartate--tRNA(Asn) ligase [Candidatus Woesearchaeota archaeon]|nr:MAG: aspartate--tRNA(Asn) ligase [Candidatus Woesearchaeota archaeon]
MRTLIKEVKEKKEVTLQGFIHEIRDLAKIKFILLRDSSGVIQCVAKQGTKAFEKLSKLTPESAVTIQGIPKSAEIKSEEATIKNLELEISDIIIHSKAEPLPIQVFEKDKSIKTDLSVRLDYRSLDLRKPKNLAIFKIEAALVEGMQSYLNSNGFTQVFTPCLMGTASESGAEVFEVKYFDKKTYLRQDPQLHRQLTILGGIEKLYDIGPSWRAEKSHTVKHVCEHRTCAVELAFIKDETDTMRIEEQLVVSALNNVNKRCQEELELLGIKLIIPKTPFPELRFPEIYDILKKEGKDIYMQDLDAEAEKILYEYVKKEFKSEFYFIDRFPSKLKPFYVMFVDEDPKFARSVDLYFKGLELSSGGQREHRYYKLIKQVKEKEVPIKSVEWFTQFFKFGAMPHGGFAIGIERLTQNLLNLSNIREAILFPRDPERVNP